MSVWDELRRRNVFKVGAAYVLIAWILAQVISVINEPLGLPDWFDTTVLVILAIGFPLALLFAWAYELTPAGLSRSGDVPNDESITHVTGRKLNYVLAGLFAGALLGSGSAWLVNFDSDDQWIREEAVPQIQALVEAEDMEAAFALAKEVEARAPEAPELSALWPSFSVRLSIPSQPEGAEVWRRAYDSASDAWVSLGLTPIADVRLPVGISRLRFELEGHVPLERTLMVGVRRDPERPIPAFLDSRATQIDTEDTLPDGKVRVPGWEQDVGGEALTFADYFLDRYEVSNREYMEFVEAGGYEAERYWRYPVMSAGEEIPWPVAMSLFVDRTGISGPSTWSGGDYPEGQADFPVAGVSWYEAAAYAEFVGEELPTTYHWQRAIDDFQAVWVLQASNMQSDGPSPVGEQPAVSWSGAYDMRGNVREWVFNDLAGEPFLSGGSWRDQPYVGIVHNFRRPPIDRSDTNGFRLAITNDDRTVTEKARQSLESLSQRDLTSVDPISEEEFEFMSRIYDYDRSPLNAAHEGSIEGRGWVRERITFDAPYTGERMAVYLYLPVDQNGPYQTVVLAPHAGTWAVPSIDAFSFEWDFLVRNGRAVALPVLQGSLERRDQLGVAMQNWHTNAGRQRLIQIHQDYRRTIDYLETRSDIDTDSLAFYGISMGGLYGPSILALEPRLKAAVLEIGGIHPDQQFLPEVDPVNFLPRVKLPVLMLNADLDAIVPLHDGAIPYFESIGTRPEDKNQIILPGGHFVPRDDTIRESLNWLDKYLGPVG